MKVQSSALGIAAAFVLVSVACSSRHGSSSGTGGSSASGGAGAGGSSGTGGQVSTGGSVSTGGAVGTGGSSGSAGGVVSCDSAIDVTPCGGNVVGTWTVASSCLKVTGLLDLSLVGTSCLTAPVTGSLRVTGTWTAKSDGTYSDETITSGEEEITLDPSCLVISSTPVTCDGAANLIKNVGYSALTCTSAANGGCTCSGTVNQTGGMGLVSYALATSGNYTTSGNMVTISGGVADVNYAYCVSGNELAWTPQSTSPTVTGTIAFRNAETGGAGGMSGAGGTSGTSGSGGMTGGTSGSGGMSGSGGTSGRGGNSGTGGTGSTTGPCDIYRDGGNPCVAAHSTVRALFGAYSGKLYQVRNSGGTTRDINTLTAGGVADAAAQDTFCSGTTCVITVLYDQSGRGNDLWYQGSGSPVSGQDVPATATTESIRVGGSKVYSLYIRPRNSYWRNGATTGIPTGAAPEGMYMVTSGTHYNSGCCFDYGNSEADRMADGAGTMDAINFSTITAWGEGAGAGPWVMADLEYGIFAQADQNTNASNPTQTSRFVTAVLKNNGTTEFALRGGNSATGGLSTYYKGRLPSGWSPMKKQGAMVLGSGGDCCATNTNLSEGTFYEGALVSGYPSDVTEDAVQANIVAARYTQ